MTPTIRLGRVFGIDISINWSLLFIFALLAWSLATAFPAQVPGRPLWQYWAAGTAGALVFYACLLAHELSHSLLARRQGLRVDGITLWLFGGVSQLAQEPRSARGEAVIAAAGPLTSLLIAAGFLAAAQFIRPGLYADLAAWLAVINLSLGVFNLVPAFPLDGGRLLASVLWARSGSRQRGVHQAVMVGRLVAYLMIGFGFLQLLTGAVLDGVWIAFLGWFLLSAASAEDRAGTIHQLLGGARVADAMTAPVVTIPDWLSVDDFLAQVAPNHAFTTYPLHDRGGAITGVLRLPDLLPNRHGTVSDVADRAPDRPIASPDEPLESMVQRVGASLRRRVLVYDEGGKLTGIVSPADIARLLAIRQAGSPNGSVPVGR